MLKISTHLLRDNAVRKIDKLSAAQEQVDGAIEAFFNDRWPTAITLAGAAEYMLPIVDVDNDMFELGKKMASSLSMSKNEAITFMNEHRDWLKHVQIDRPVTQSFDQNDVLIMILRAYLRLRSITHFESEPMCVFRSWIEKNTVTESPFPLPQAGEDV